MVADAEALLRDADAEAAAIGDEPANTEEAVRQAALGQVVQHLHRSTADAQMHTTAPDPEITVGREAVDGGLRRCGAEKRLGNLARHAQAVEGLR